MPNKGNKEYDMEQICHKNGGNMKVILASASPRRKELLAQMGIPFSCMPSQKEEQLTSDSPKEVVKQLSLQKAEDILQQTEGDILVIGSDTIVVCEEKILGKPKSEEEAFYMLNLLQGRTHFVYTGVAILYRKAGKVESNLLEEHTAVEMYHMTEAEILSYIATKEPMDKAGAYAIQGRGAVYIQGIHGEYNTVVGFPIARVYQELKKMKLMEQILAEETYDKTDCK